MPDQKILENIKYWDRAIILMDLNAFFASIEQLDFPELKNKPVAVTNGNQGTCIITCSYEARKFGIKTGMRMYDAKKLCPDIIQRPARPNRYAQVSSKIMASLYNITPDIEIFSVDEAFLDVTNCQLLHGSPLTIAKMVKKLIYNTSGLLCSVGVSGDKTTAKYAAKLQKPDGLTIIHPNRSRDVLAKVPVTDLCGIAQGIGRFLANNGVLLCGDIIKIPMSVLQKKYGPLGTRIWFMAQGLDPSEVKQRSEQPKSVGHGKVLPPNTIDKKTILIYFRHMSEKVAARLRRYNLQSKKYYIAIRLNCINNNINIISQKLNLEQYSNDGLQIYRLCEFLLESYWHGEGVFQVQVTALDPAKSNLQADLFSSVNLDTNDKINNLNKITDAINNKYGEFFLQPASLIDRSEMPNVIAPAWRPLGIRNSI